MSRGLVMVCDVDLGLADATRTHTLAVAAGFAAEGLEVDLVARGPGPDSELAGLRYHPADAAEHPPLRRAVAVNRRALPLLWRRRCRAHLCYVRHSWTLVPVLLAARALGYRLVTQVDDVPYGRGYEGEINPIADRVKCAAALLMGRLAHGVVAVTGEIRGLLVELFHVPAERVAVLPNGVDLELVRPLDRAQAVAEAGLDPDCEYVVFMGRLAPWVDFDLILDAFVEVVSRRPAARLLLVGGGEEQERIDAGVERRGLAEQVLRTGFLQDRARVAGLLGAATVGLAANRAEHTARIGLSPTKLAEYFAAARPVVAVDMPSLTPAIESAGAGIVVPAQAPALAEAVVSLLADPARAESLGRAGRRAAESGYSWRSIVQRTLPLFER